MTVAFIGIAELDFGEQLSATVTPEFYRRLLDQVLAMADSIVLLQGEILSGDDHPPLSEQIDLKRGGAADTSTRFWKQAQAGYRLALVVPVAEDAVRFLESLGYERSAEITSGSASAVRGWEVWLQQNLPDAKGAMVFGHDFEPAFVFQRADSTFNRNAASSK